MTQRPNLWNRLRSREDTVKPAQPAPTLPPAPPKLNLWDRAGAAPQRAQPAELTADEKATAEKIAQEARERANAEQLDEFPAGDPRDRRYGPRKGRLPPEKRRKACMNFSVSREEEILFKNYADSLDMTFSAWARKTLFAAMGRKIPDRPDEHDD